MNVSELVELLNQFTFSNVPTSKQRTEYLRCLNLANWDLFQRVLNCNLFYESGELTIGDDGKYTITDDIYHLKKIYVSNHLIKPIDDKDDYLQLSNNEYYRQGKSLRVKVNTPQLNVDGKEYIDIIYIKTPKKLVESINDDEMEVVTPVFAEPYHLTLVQGALYYTLLSTKGYSEKTTIQYATYKESLKNFDSFYNYS